MILYVHFVMVAGKGDRKTFEAYNYCHSVIRFEESRGYFVGILRVESESPNTTDYLSRDQAARYRSGRMVADVFSKKPHTWEMTGYLGRYYPDAFEIA